MINLLLLRRQQQHLQCVVAVPAARGGTKNAFSFLENAPVYSRWRMTEEGECGSIGSKVAVRFITRVRIFLRHDTCYAMRKIAMLGTPKGLPSARLTRVGAVDNLLPTGISRQL